MAGLRDRAPDLLLLLAFPANWVACAGEAARICETSCSPSYGPTPRQRQQLTPLGLAGLSFYHK
eukprot:scaffold247445_cov21-Prasinocladus_malaysianus.AAC.1